MSAPAAKASIEQSERRRDAPRRGTIDWRDAATGSGRVKRDYVRQIFSEIAPRYDLLNRVLSLSIDTRWRRLAIEQLNWRNDPKGTYLDLCAGTLDVAQCLARRRGFEGRVIGADFAEPMLRNGLSKVRRDPVSPVAADALEMPLRDNTVSGAIVAFGIRNVADLDRGLREAWRVLRPGGRFVVLEFTTPRSPIIRRLYHLYLNQLLPRIGRLVSGHRTAYTYLPTSVAHFPIEEALAARFRDAGFADVRFTRLTFGIAAIHVGVKADPSLRSG